MSKKRRKMRIEIYPDKQRRWRWRARASNGNIVADSGQGYSSKWHVNRAIRSLFDGVLNWEVPYYSRRSPQFTTDTVVEKDLTQLSIPVVEIKEGE